MPAASLNRVRAAPFRNDRGYFHRPTGVNAWKVRLAGAALVLTLGWAAVAFVLWPRHLHAVCTHGELHRAHAPWANQCDACHVPYTSGGAPGGLFETRDRWRTFRCETCHPGPPADIKNYAPHYDRSRPEHAHLADDAQARDCSSCHHDHQGKDFALARVGDAACSRCHANLPAMGSKDLAPKVTAFHDDHPEFRVSEDNRRRASATTTADRQWRGLKFNHGLHLALGMVENKLLDKPEIQFTLDKVAPAYKEQYQRFADAGSAVAALKLDCSACHQLSGGAGQPADPRAGGAARLPGANLTTVPADGAYYLPVTFEQHCQGCHKLDLPSAPLDAGPNITGFDVPHRLRREEVERFVRGEVIRQAAKRDEFFPKALGPPSDRLDTPRPAAVSPALRDAVDRLVGQYTGLLYEAPAGGPQSTGAGGRSCYKCHRPGEKEEVRPTRGFTLWMPKSRFDHAAHKAMNCVECHDTWDRADFKRFAYEPDKPDEPVNVTGGIDNCRRCHAPAGHVVHGRPALDVRNDCQTCHRYHRESRALPAARDRLMVEDLIRGNRP